MLKKIALIALFTTQIINTQDFLDTNIIKKQNILEEILGEIGWFFAPFAAFIHITLFTEL